MSIALHRSPTSHTRNPEALEHVCERLCAAHGDLAISDPMPGGTVRITCIEPHTDADKGLSWLFTVTGDLTEV
jgi:hypothetical protein